MFELIEQPSLLSNIKPKHVIATVVLGGVLSGVLGVANHFYQKNEMYYHEAKSGIVKANKKSRIFHIPHCPNYNNMDARNVIEFQTIADAESKRFRAAQNCPNNIVKIRRDFEAK